MARSKSLWVPVLVGCLVAVLLGPAGGGAGAVEPRTVTASIMISDAAFSTNNDVFDYAKGSAIQALSGSPNFAAPLSFPVPVVSIRKITLYAYDSDPGKNVCVRLYRSRPADGTANHLGVVCTVDTTADPQTAYTTEISPRQVNTAFHGPMLMLYLSAPGVKFYGVKITYTYETGA